MSVKNTNLPEEKKETQEKDNTIVHFEQKTRVKYCLRQDELPNIIFLKDRTQSENGYKYISKYSGVVKETTFVGLKSKIEEELMELDWFRENPIPLHEKGKEGYNLIAETIKSVDGIIVTPFKPFGIVKDDKDPAFRYFNFYRTSPVKKRLLAEIERINGTEFDKQGFSNSDDLELDFDDEFLPEMLEEYEINGKSNTHSSFKRKPINAGLTTSERDSVLNKKPEEIKLAKTVDELWDKLQNYYTHYRVLFWNYVGGEFLDGDEKEREARQKHLLNWMAKVMRPETGKCGTSIVARGKQRTGKSALVDNIFAYVFPDLKIIGKAAMESGFNEGVDKTSFIFFNEVEIQDNKGPLVYNKLKEYVTDYVTEVIAKGKDGYTANIFFNSMFAQNPVKPMKFEAGCGRYTVFMTGERQLKDLVREEFGYTDIRREYFPYIEKYERDEFIMDLLNIEVDEDKAASVYLTPEKIELMTETNTSEVVISEIIKKGGFSTLLEDGYVTPYDLVSDEEKDAVIKFFIESSLGYLTEESKRVYAYFALLHKKGNDKKLNMAAITEKQIVDIMKKSFTKKENKRVQIDGERRRFMVIDKNKYDKNKVTEGFKILNDRDETYKKYFEITEQEYLDEAEYSELIHRIYK